MILFNVSLNVSGKNFKFYHHYQSGGHLHLGRTAEFVLNDNMESNKNTNNTNWKMKGPLLPPMQSDDRINMDGTQELERQLLPDFEP